MANNTINPIIKKAVYAIAQANADILFNMIYNDVEIERAESRRKLLRKVKKYLVRYYNLDANDLDDNTILAVFRNDEDVLTLFALNL